MQILRIIIFTILLVSVTAYVLATKQNANYKTWNNNNNENIEYNVKNRNNNTKSNKSEVYIKENVIRPVHMDPLYFLAKDGWKLAFVITIGILLYSYLPIYHKMRRPFWPISLNRTFITLENYLSFGRSFFATQNSRNNMYQDIYQTYNLPVGFV